MRAMMSFFTALVIGAASAHAIILLPGKIEEPVRANKIIEAKYKGKKAFLDKHRKRIKQKFAELKTQKQNVAGAPLGTPAALREENTVRSKGVATDGTMVPDGKAMQETR
ncbi:MAG: hypothetical protein K0R29_2800 [Pseudobdellovibrio sp.]|jgi:hypothetical protein|nr:hypothetical protein [Pseudobdellovibrio sp.]